MTRQPPPRSSQIPLWPQPFDPATELNWGDPVVSRRLLREHLDQSHDGASRRTRTVDAHLRRLRRLLPAAPSRLLDAACGPGLYAVRLAAAGHDVTGVDVGPSVLSHARRLARELHVEAHCRFLRGNLLEHHFGDGYDAALLIYHVIENFPRPEQRMVLHRLMQSVMPGGRVIVEMRLRPDQFDERVSSWDVVERSLLSDRQHLLLTDTTWDERSGEYILREVAVFDDGSTATQQTTGLITPLQRIPALFDSAGLRVERIYDGWSRFVANPLSDSVLVVATRR